MTTAPIEAVPIEAVPIEAVPIEQRRILATAIPGPRSELLHKRKLSAVSAGVGTGLPVYVERAGGGIVVDVDGNQLIDFGSGIAVTTVGNANRETATSFNASPVPMPSMMRSGYRQARVPNACATTAGL